MEASSEDCIGEMFLCLQKSYMFDCVIVIGI